MPYETYSINVSTNFAKDLETISKITGEPITGMIARLLDDYTDRFRNANGKVRLIPGLIMPNEETIKFATISGGEQPVPEACWIIQEGRHIFGQPYTQVYKDGQMLQVPAERIKYAE